MWNRLELHELRRRPRGPGTPRRAGAWHPGNRMAVWDIAKWPVLLVIVSLMSAELR
jgi:hypothetical protein